MKPIYKFLKLIWSLLGSLNFGLILSSLLAIDAALAYPLIKSHLTTFIPLGEIGLWDWLNSYGRYNLGHTFWFFLLMILLTFLAINTFICSTDRLILLLKNKNRQTNWPLKLGPHIMHYAVLIILTGYLGSYSFSQNFPGRALKMGEYPIKLPFDSEKVSLTASQPIYYHGHRLDFFNDYILDPGFILTFQNSSGLLTNKKLAYNQPISYKGYNFYLYDFYPKHKVKSDKNLNYLKITIRKDPFSKLYLAGLSVFALGLFLYGLNLYKEVKKDR
jgi:cytochrome c biogenesis protein ResB